MSTTRTGSFPIGFRRPGSEWSRKDPVELARWARQTGFALIDLMNVSPQDLKVLSDHGLKLGSADLLDFGRLMSADAGVRKETVAKNVAYVTELVAAGVKVFFTCVIPGDPSKPRAENYKLAVECFAPIAHAAAAGGATVAIEGYPGGYPWYPSFCCTPETVRLFLKDVGDGVSINYDPSHLIRLGVDHVRFLREFVGRVTHVHAKDTELFDEAVYELGLYQPAVGQPSHRWGGHTWRYTLPGHGCARWTEILKILSDSGYRGAVSVELEDENFNGSEQGEKSGLTHSLAFLRGV